MRRRRARRVRRWRRLASSAGQSTRRTTGPTSASITIDPNATKATLHLKSGAVCQLAAASRCMGQPEHDKRARRHCDRRREARGTSSGAPPCCWPHTSRARSSYWYSSSEHCARRSRAAHAFTRDAGAHRQCDRRVDDASAGLPQIMSGDVAGQAHRGRIDGHCSASTPTAAWRRSSFVATIKAASWAAHTCSPVGRSIQSDAGTELARKSRPANRRDHGAARRERHRGRTRSTGCRGARNIRRSRRPVGQHRRRCRFVGNPSSDFTAALRF